MTGFFLVFGIIIYKFYIIYSMCIILIHIEFIYVFM